MEDMAQEIMEQLGLQSRSKITFQDFLRFRGQVREANRGRRNVLTDQMVIVK
jgi:hypothetical protein